MDSNKQIEEFLRNPKNLTIPELVARYSELFPMEPDPFDTIEHLTDSLTARRALEIAIEHGKPIVLKWDQEYLDRYTIMIGESVFA